MPTRIFPLRIARTAQQVVQARSNPRHRPFHEPKLILQPTQGRFGRHRNQSRLYPHCALLKHLPVPEIGPAFGRVVEDHHRRDASALLTQALLRAPRLLADDRGPRRRAEQACERARELSLRVLGCEEVENVADADRGDAPPERVEGRQSGELRRGRRGRRRGGVGCGRCDFEESGIEGVSRQERDREGGGCGVEQLMSKSPEF